MRNMILLHVNNKGLPQPLHPHTLISAFIISSPKCAIVENAIYKILILYLVSVAEQTGLSHTPMAGFLASAAPSAYVHR